MSHVLVATLVDTRGLLKVVLASLVASVGITALFSVAIVGVARSLEWRRNGRPLAAGAFTVLAFVALVGCAAAVTLGIVVMTSK
jgi:hypothetical protein